MDSADSLCLLSRFCTLPTCFCWLLHRSSPLCTTEESETFTSIVNLVFLRWALEQRVAPIHRPARALKSLASLQPVQAAGKQRRLPRRPGFSAMTRPHPRHAPPLMLAQSAFANSLRTPMDRKRLSFGRAVAMHCIWVVSPIWLLMSGSCAVPHAGRHGRPQPPRPSQALATHMVSLLRNQPQITTLPRVGTTKPLHQDLLPTSCRSAARGSCWRTRRMRMLLGKNYLTGTCTGCPSTHGKLAAGRPSGFACAAVPVSMNAIRCCKACQYRPPALRTVLAGSPSTCASSVADGPCSLNLRRSRRGAAPGPSGYTAEIVRLIHSG